MLGLEFQKKKVWMESSMWNDYQLMPRGDKSEVSQDSCGADPYNNNFLYSEELPGITYKQVYYYLVNIVHSESVHSKA